MSSVTPDYFFDHHNKFKPNFTGFLNFKMNIPEIAEEYLSLIEKEIPERGFTSIDHFLSDEEANNLLSRILELESEESFKKAGIGKHGDFQVNAAIRNDRIRWIDPLKEHPALAPLARKVNFMMHFLNRSFFLSIKDYEMHYAIYLPGTYYRKHSDQFRQNRHRQISMVCYFNPGWQPGDGGELRIYHNQIYTDNTPLHGRMILFKSSLEHEVLPTKAKRFSITGWMLDQPTGLSFIQ